MGGKCHNHLLFMSMKRMKERDCFFFCCCLSIYKCVMDDNDGKWIAWYLRKHNKWKHRMAMLFNKKWIKNPKIERKHFNANVSLCTGRWGKNNGNEKWTTSNNRVVHLALVSFCVVSFVLAIIHPQLSLFGEVFFIHSPLFFCPCNCSEQRMPFVQSEG